MMKGEKKMTKEIKQLLLSNLDQMLRYAEAYEEKQKIQGMSKLELLQAIEELQVKL